MKNHMTRIVIFAIIAILIAVLELIILPITALVILSFASIVIAVVICAASLMKLVSDDKKNLIANSAMPFVLDGYLGWTLFFSVLFVLLECFNIFKGGAANTLFLVLQLLAVAFAAWKVFLVSAGREEIIRVDNKIAAQTSSWKMLAVDMEAILKRAPAEMKKDIQSAYEAIRYADPMSLPELADQESKIRENIALLDNAVNNKEFAVVSDLCEKLKQQISDRANRMKILK